MPTYEYECLKCGHTFERFQSMTEEPVKRCPECRCKVRRLFGSGAGIMFKGQGFYETDYRGESYEKDKKADAAPEKKADGDSSAKSDGDSSKKSGSDSSSGAGAKETSTKKSDSSAKKASK